MTTDIINKEKAKSVQKHPAFSYKLPIYSVIAYYLNQWLHTMSHKNFAYSITISHNYIANDCWQHCI